MTSPRSANAAALPSDRRAFLGNSLALASVIAGSAATAAVADKHPDAELIELAAIHAAAVARRNELYQLSDEAFDNFEPPEIPQALVWRPTDAPHLCESPDKCSHYSFGDAILPTYDAGVEDLSQWAQRFAVEGDSYQNSLFNHAARARTREIMAAHEEWTAAILREEDAAGLTQLNEAENHVSSSIDDLRLRIVATRAQTAEGICVKARVASLNLSSNANWIEEVLLPRCIAAEPRSIAEQSLDVVIVSLIVDALRLGRKAPLVLDARGEA